MLLLYAKCYSDFNFSQLQWVYFSNMNIRKILVGFVALALIVYLMGPKPETPILSTDLSVLNVSLDEIEDHVSKKEAAIENIKPENEARIIWADSIPQKTKYVMVYLHGFSASGMEGSPIHQQVADRYGFNLYLPRLYGHGVKSDDVFIDLTADRLWNSAREVIEEASVLGDSIIIMGCSTGGTLGLFAAAHYSQIHSIILYSPNIDLANRSASMLIKPWGLQLARKMFGGLHREFDATEEQQKYWTNRYRLEGLVNMKQLVDHTMTESTFGKITQPLFLGYYYKNDEEQDDIVSIPRMKEMLEQINTPFNKIVEQPFAKAGGHVINSEFISEDVEGVYNETVQFIENVLQINRLDP